MEKKLKWGTKWFTWHFFPKPSDMTVKSIVETSLYFIVFCVCCWLFYSWNQVPVRRESITLDCLSKPSQYPNEDIAPVAVIKYCIPMTSTDLETEEESMLYRVNSIIRDKNTNSVIEKDLYKLMTVPEPVIKRGIFISFSQWKTNFYMDDKKGMFISDSHNHDNSMNDSIRKEETGKSEFWNLMFSDSEYLKEGNYPYGLDNTNDFSKNKNHPYWSSRDHTKIRNKRFILYNSEFYKKFEKKRDSLQRIFRHFADSLAIADTTIQEYITKLGDNYQAGHPLYYYRIERSRIWSPWNREFEDVSPDYDNQGLDISYRRADKSVRIDETFMSCKDQPMEERLINVKEAGFFSDHPYRLPHWFRLEDISQAYYDIRVNSWMIDSIVLTFDFVGATTFSKMQPEPDRITMSSITFSDPEKMMDIRIHGLKFHARFNELENRQYIRMIAITTIMGGMVTIFIAMIIVALMSVFMKNKIIASKKKSRSDNIQNTDHGQIETERDK